MTDVAPEDGARFRQVLRGYDKTEVDAAIKRLTREVEALGAEVARLGAEGPPPAPATPDLDAFAVDVASVLRAAQEAADDLRERTEAETASLRAEAEAAAERLLSESRARAEAAVSDAEEDVRIIRAEAEREAHRITAAARKESEDLLRSARLDADRVHADAASERDEILAQARAEAEAAQERARALEIRRDELLAELESVRSTVARLEGEIDETRATPPTPRAPEPEIEEFERPAEEETYSGVRIIPARDDEEEPETGPVGQPVETMAMVEEVRRLHEAPEPEPAEAPDEPADEPAAPASEPEPDDTEPEEAPAPEEVQPEAVEPEAPTDDDRSEAVADSPPTDDDLDDLFAALRSPAATSPDDVEPSPTVDESEPPAEPAEPEPEPEPPVEPAESEPEPVPPAAAEPRRPARDAHDPEVERALEDRDRRLIPITNGALRGMKRELADAQNEALEGLRADPDGWRPSRAELAEHLEPTLLLVRDAARRAGVAWTLESLGVEVAVPGQRSGNGSAAAGDLAASLERALDRGTDGPSRSAEVSRVFRTWRSDTAERHLRAEAGRAYHEGIADTAEAAGRTVELVVVRACPQCAEAAEASDPPIPPIHDGCRCILLPTG